MNNYSILNSLQESIFRPDVSDLKDSLLEYSELAIDSVMEDGILKDIPILGTIASLCKTGINIHDRHLLKQTALFLVSVNDGTIPPETIIEHKKILEEDPKKGEAELSRVLLLINRSTEQIQAIILGSFYKAYINGLITWGKFCELTEANNRMFLDDYELLRLFYKYSLSQRMILGETISQAQRLVSLGLLIQNHTEATVTDQILNIGLDVPFTISPLGKLFVDLLPEDMKKDVPYKTDDEGCGTI